MISLLLFLTLPSPLQHPFINKLMILTEPLRLGLKLYLSNMQRMLNKDLT